MKKITVIVAILMVYACGMFAATDFTAPPELTTDEANPVVYAIVSYRGDSYSVNGELLMSALKADGFSNPSVITTEIDRSALWYFTDSGDGGVYIHSLEYSGGVATDLSATLDDLENCDPYYIYNIDYFKGHGVVICIDSEFEEYSSCLDAAYNAPVLSPGWSPQPGDWYGTCWFFVKIDDPDDLTVAQQVCEDAFAECHSIVDPVDPVDPDEPDEPDVPADSKFTARPELTTDEANPVVYAIVNYRGDCYTVKGDSLMSALKADGFQNPSVMTSEIDRSALWYFTDAGDNGVYIHSLQYSNGAIEGTSATLEDIDDCAPYYILDSFFAHGKGVVISTNSYLDGNNNCLDASDSSPILSPGWKPSQNDWAGTCWFFVKIDDPDDLTSAQKACDEAFEEDHAIPPVPGQFIYQGLKYVADDNGETCRLIGCADHSMTTLTIPEVAVDNGVSYRVTKISSDAFKNHSHFTGNLVIPDNIERIYTGAFMNCTGFDGTLTLGNSLWEIGNEAFRGCSGFTGDLVIPDNIEYIGNGAFQNCTGFNGTLTLSNSMEEIRHFAFYYCSGFTGDLIIPESVTEIGSCAFDGCSGFNGTLTLGNSLRDISASAFRNCSGLTGDLVIPNSVTSLGEAAFNFCSGFDGTLTLSNSLTTISRNAFWYASGLTGDLVIPNSVKTIEGGAFSYCSGLNGTLTLSNSLIEIERAAFSYTNLTGSIVIPDGVVSIGSTAFEKCPGFTGDLIIPESVTEIGSYAFSGCTGLNGTLKLPSNLKIIESSTFAGCSNLTGNLIIPNTVETIGWFAFQDCRGFTGDLVIPNSVKVIDTGAFFQCSGFDGTLTLGNSLTSIGNCAFQNCTGFTGDLIIPDSVIEIGERGFNNCTGFNGKLKLSSSLTTLGNYAFCGDSGFTGDLVIPNSVTRIPIYAFSECSGFDGTLTLGNSLTFISNGAFSGCSGFKGDLVIPNSVTEIWPTAFYGCSGFNGTLTLSNSLTFIEYGVFYECSGFKGELVIPNTVNYIGSYAFYNCSGFTGELNIPDSVTEIGEYAFYGCSGFTGELEIPEEITEIGEGSFAGSTLTGDLIIPTSVTVIGANAFADCEKLDGELIIPASVTEIGDRAFLNCPNLTAKTCLATVPPVLGVEVFDEGSTIFVPAESLSQYKADAQWSQYRLMPVGEEDKPQIELNLMSATLNIGEKLQLTATVTPDNDVKFAWSSLNTDIVLVNNTGLVTAKGAGSTAVMVTTSNGLCARCEIKVIDPTGVDSVSDNNQVKITGRSIEAPAGSRVIDLSGTEVGASNLAPGTYIVILPSSRPLKVVIR